MRNKHGFTLIELLVTISIMVMVGLVIVTNMSGILSKNEDEDYEAFIKKIEDSACMYIELKGDKKGCRSTNGCSIPLSDLIKNGYIEENLKDPSTGNMIDKNETVSISWPDNVKTCKFR